MMPQKLSNNMPAKVRLLFGLAAILTEKPLGLVVDKGKNH
jgi:hypothetical protein